MKAAIQQLRQYSIQDHDSAVPSAELGKRALRPAVRLGALVRGLDGVWRNGEGAIVNVTQKLFSGRFFNILEPNVTDFEAEDLAIGLSRDARWGGQTPGEFPYSVAQHSVLVTRILQLKYKINEKEVLLYGLLHDSEEGLGLKDTVTGLKHVFGEAYLEVMNAIRETVHLKYGLKWPPPDPVYRVVKKADLVAGATEAVHLMNFKLEDYRRRIRRNVMALPNEPPWDHFMKTWPPQAAKESFLAELGYLWGIQNL